MIFFEKKMLRSIGVGIFYKYSAFVRKAQKRKMYFSYKVKGFHALIYYKSRLAPGWGLRRAGLASRKKAHPALAFTGFCRSMPRMHEMSLAVSLLDIIRQEMEKHRAERLVRISLRYGALANVVPESLLLAFEVQSQGTPFEGARLELTEEALRLRCNACGREFAPEAAVAGLFSACPGCGEDFGHQVLAGKELYIDHLELE